MLSAHRTVGSTAHVTSGGQISSSEAVGNYTLLDIMLTDSVNMILLLVFWGVVLYKNVHLIIYESSSRTHGKK